MAQSKISMASLLAAGVSPAIAAKYNKGLNASEASAVKQTTGMDIGFQKQATENLTTSLNQTKSPYVQKPGVTMPSQEKYGAGGFSPVSSMSRSSITDQTTSLQNIYQNSMRDPIAYLASIAKRK